MHGCAVTRHLRWENMNEDIRILIATLICLVLIVAGTAKCTGLEAGSNCWFRPAGWLRTLMIRMSSLLHVAPNRNSYDAGHVSGARFLPLSDVAVTRNGTSKPTPPVDAMKIAFERVGGRRPNRVL